MESVLTDKQLLWLTVFLYFAILIFGLQMALTVHNCYAYLYRQRKFKVIPILVFYILTVVLTGLRLFYFLMFYGNLENQYVFAMLGLPLVKINMGLNQCWMLIELTLNVRNALKISHGTLHLSSESAIS